MDLKSVPSIELLQELAIRGGHPGAVAEAVMLCVRKSQDYNNGASANDMHCVDRSNYFPFGAVSYAQMIHTKALRFNSLVGQKDNPNFEGLTDTALDIINYAGFFIADKHFREKK